MSEKVTCDPKQIIMQNVLKAMPNSQSVKPDSTITCPHCGYSQTDTMPTDRCQFFWKCPSCETVLKPKEGDCCVYCSYGDTPCPPIQAGNCGSDTCCS